MPVKCPICGAAHAACGAGRAPVNVVDLTPASRRPKVAELALYEVEYPSMTTRQKLSAEDAELIGYPVRKVGEVKKVSPVEVSRPGYADDSSNVESVAPPSPEDVDELDDEEKSSKASSAKTKARTPANKSV